MTGSGWVRAQQPCSGVAVETSRAGVTSNLAVGCKRSRDGTALTEETAIFHKSLSQKKLQFDCTMRMPRVSIRCKHFLALDLRQKGLSVNQSRSSGDSLFRCPRHLETTSAVADRPAQHRGLLRVPESDGDGKRRRERLSLGPPSERRCSAAVNPPRRKPSTNVQSAPLVPPAPARNRR